MDSSEFLYDGEGYYSTITDSSSLIDECIEAYLWIPEAFVTSKATIRDLYAFDTIQNIIDDPGYLILQTASIHLDNLNDLKVFTTDNLNNFIGVSEKFIWKTTPTGELINQKFLSPTCEGNIIACKWYDNSLYVLHTTIIPQNIYYIASDILAIGDTARVYNINYGSQYFPYEFRYPSNQWVRVSLPEYTVFRISKYDSEGALINYFDILSASSNDSIYYGNKLVAPVAMDIFNGNIYIADTGDATIKLYTATYGIYVGTILNNNSLYKPLQIFAENENYVWVVDVLQNTSSGNTHSIKRFDIRYSSVELEVQYRNKPLLAFSRENNLYDSFVIYREDGIYKYYKNFIYKKDISDILNGHSIQNIAVENSNYLYILNKDPVDIRIINIVTKTTTNLRECTAPITIQDFIIEDDKTLLSDSGLQEVGFYYLFGVKDDVIINHVVPKGIINLDDVYYAVDIRNYALFKITNNTTLKIYNSDFRRPYDIATDNTYLYVIDNGANCIFKLDVNGNTLQKIGQEGSDFGKFNFPTSIAIQNDIIYVLDSGNFRMQLFTLSGEFIKSFELSPAVGTITKTYTETININGDKDDAVSGTNGTIIWGDLNVNNINRLCGVRFPITLNKKGIEITNATITLNRKTPLYTSKGIITMENTTQSFPYANSSFNDLLNRSKLSTIYDIVWNIPSSPSTVTTPNLKNLLTQVISLETWDNVDTNYISVIFIRDTNTSNNTFLSNTAILNISYNVHTPIRRKGMFYHLALDEEYMYISDIFSNVINMYNKDTGELLDSYPFYGTIMEKLSRDIFITNRDCSIAYLNKFSWESEKNYSMEINDNATHILYNFEPIWETQEYTETFEQSFEIDFFEDFEWFNINEFVLENYSEFELTLPEINDWVL